MKKNILLVAIIATGCGEVFVSSSGNSETIVTGSGGEMFTASGSGGSGETINIHSKQVNLHKNCRQEVAYIPAQHQKDTYIVSCYQAESIEAITGFTYDLFGGVYDVFGCNTNTHYAAWFKPSIIDQKIIDIEQFDQTLIESSSLNWSIQDLNGYSGPRTTVKVILSEKYSLQEGDWFCLGSKFAFDDQGKPNCPVMCISDEKTNNFYISTLTEYPYDFISMFQLGNNFNFISTVTAYIK